MAIPPLVDVFLERHAYRWCRLLPDGKGDLVLETCDGESVGEAQGWVEDVEVSMLLPFRDLWAWALREGLAPGQPFCVWVSMPVYYQDYFGEHDFDFDWDIVAVRPARNPAASWERLLAQREESLRKRRNHLENLERRRWKNLSEMRVDFRFLVDGTVHASLTTKVGLRSGTYELAYGEGGNFKEAFEELVRAVSRQCPRIDRPILEGIRDDRRVGMSTWARLCG